jgi:integrase
LEPIQPAKGSRITFSPAFPWLKAPDPAFDFLEFEVALRTGMRQGEILALRWEDVDLVKGQLSVRRSVTREIITTPKS